MPASHRRAAWVAAAALLLVAPAAASGACPESPRANGTGKVPRANAGSLPPAGTGPEILHRKLAQAPQLENTRRWNATPILVSGAHAYRGGEFLSQDHLFDDRALPYPGDRDRYAGNAADIVEVRLEPQARATAVRITLNSMLDPGAAAIAIALGDSDRPHPLPHGAGASTRGEVFLTMHGCAGDAVRAADGQPAAAQPSVTTDLARRQVHVELPYAAFDPRGRTVRVTAAAGLWDTGAGAYLRPDPARPAFYDVAFDGPGRWTINTWKDEEQRAALAAGDLSPLHADVDFRKLAARTTDEGGVPRTGPMNRILVSQFETAQGRGTSSGGDIVGNFLCDPPACTYQYSGRLQPYSVYVPDKPRPADGFGLVLNLHGASSNHNHFENGSTEGPLSVWRMLAEEGHPSVMVLPNARGGTYCYHGMAGADPFEAWADVAARLELDPDHALLTGSSMGGYGTYKLAAQFPDLFKAIFPNIAPEICAFTEVLSVVDLPSGRTNVGPTFPSLRNVPVLATSGLNDPLVNAVITNRTLGRFDELGQRHDFWHFLDPSIQGHVEYRHFARDAFAALNRSSASVDRNPRRVRYVVNGAFVDRRHGLDSDHAYWVGGLELAEPDAARARGSIDVTSGAIPGRRQTVLAPERSAGTSIHGSSAYTRQSRRWRAGDPEPLSDAFVAHVRDLRAATLDVRRMRLPEFGAFDGTVTTDTPLTLRLAGTFGAATTAVRDGDAVPVATDGRTATLTLPAGTSRIRVTQPAPIVLPPRCGPRRTVRVRVRAPRGDRLRTVRISVGGKRVKTVSGRALRRPMRVRIPARRTTRVTVRATTRKGRVLVRTRTYRRC